MPLDLPDGPRRPRRSRRSDGGGSNKPPRRTVGLAIFLFLVVPAVTIAGSVAGLVYLHATA